MLPRRNNFFCEIHLKFCNSEYFLIWYTEIVSILKILTHVCNRKLLQFIIELILEQLLLSRFINVMFIHQQKMIIFTVMQRDGTIDDVATLKVSNIVFYVFQTNFLYFRSLFHIELTFRFVNMVKGNEAGRFSQICNLLK